MERRLKPLGVLPAQLPILLSLAEAGPPMMDKGNAEALTGFSEAEKIQYLSFLERIIANLTRK